MRAVLEAMFVLRVVRLVNFPLYRAPGEEGGGGSHQVQINANFFFYLVTTDKHAHPIWHANGHVAGGET